MNSSFADEASRCREAQLTWAPVLIRERLRHIRRLRHLLAESADELALTVTQDVGRPADEVLATDLLPTADACRFLENQACRVLAPRRVPSSHRPVWLFGCRDTVHRRPHGVVGVIGTWNYPIFLNAVQIVQALTAGNGVLWKPSEYTPQLATRLTRLFREAGFPDDLFITLPATREAGPQLAEAAIDHLVFTGSAFVGRRLAARLGERLISSTLELSGCDAMIVAADAPVDLAARAAWWGVTLNQGQTCLAVRRVFVHQSVLNPFVDQLRQLASDAHARPLVAAGQAEQAEKLVRQAVEKGAVLLVAGADARAEDDPPRFPPTIVLNATPEMAICREAAFAPIAGIIPFHDLDEVKRSQRECPFGLGVSIFTRDSRTASAWALELQAGTVCINDVIAPTAHPATPFGGCGESGWGVTQGAEGLLGMTVPQTVSVRSGSFRPHYANHPAMADLMRGLLQWKHAERRGDRWRGFWRTIRAGMRFR